MIRLDMDQGSEEWLAIRRGIPTASGFKRIMTEVKRKRSASADKYCHELLAEWLLDESVDGASTGFMQRGIQTEMQAVRHYEFDHDVTTDRVGFIMRDDRLVGCSPDRFVGDDGLLEVKVPSAATHVGYMFDMASEYTMQCQAQMWLTGRKWCDLLSFSPALPPATVRIERNDAFISDLERCVNQFVEDMLAKRRLLEEMGCVPRSSNMEMVA